MNALIKNGEIVEIKCGDDFAYLFTDNNDYSEAKDRASRSEVGDMLVRFMKIRLNGQIGLHYLTKGFSSLDSIVDGISAEEFLALAADLFGNIIKIRENGFLSTRGIECSTDRVFVDPIKGRCRLVYLPGDIGFYKSETQFDDAVKQMLFSFIVQQPWKENISVKEFSDMLCDRNIGVEEICAAVGNRRKTEVKSENADVNKNPGRLRLVGITGSAAVVDVDKDSFIIGKRPEQSDGVITDNRLISRVHCKIIKKTDGTYAVTDLGSMNGTYVNNERVSGENGTAIKDGDVLRLANSDFRVEMRDER